MQNGKHLELSLKTLAATILLGLLGNLLLREVSWGIGFTLYFTAILVACAYLYRKGIAPISSGVLWLIPPALLFASAVAWRDATSLKFLNGTALALIIGVAALKRHQDSISIGTVVDYPFRLFGRWLEFIGDGLMLWNLEGRWPQLAQMNGGRHVSSVARGLLIALPLLLLFGGLFASADAAFERLLTNSITFSFEDAVANVSVTVGCAWLVGGFLRRMFLIVEAPPLQYEGPPHRPPSEPAKLGIIEVATVLGLLNLLFLMFVGTQLPYFFGGENLVQSTAGLGYADYARRGFFELAAVAGLALPVLLGAHSLLKNEGSIGPKVFKAMAGVLVGLLFVVIASAAYRMQLYVDVYGISMLRIYVLATIAWLGAVFGWFAITVLRDRPQRFAFGGLVMLLGGIFVLDLINPEALTARINTTRSSAAFVDTSYLKTLSSDAVPELVNSLKVLDKQSAQAVKADLENRDKHLSKSDWRAWTLSQTTAKQALAQVE